MFNTGGVFDKFQKEEREKMMMLGAQIMRMHLLGKSIKEISEQTNLSEQELEELLRDTDY